MNNTQLYSLLSGFSVYELNSFGKFVRSPYFNSSRRLIIYFDEIKGCIKKGKSLQDKKRIYRRIYPGEKYNDGRMRFLSSELLSLAEEFCAVSALRKDSFGKCMYSFQGLVERNRIPQAKKKLGEAGKYLIPRSYPGEMYYYIRYKHFSASGYIGLLMEKTPGAEVFTGEAENIIMLMMTVLFQSVYNLNTLSRTFNVKPGYDIAADFLMSFDLKGFVDRLRSAGHPKAALAELYHDLLCLVDNTAESGTYYKVRDMVTGLVGELNKQDIYNIISALKSYCVQRELEGKSGFHYERFELSKLSLELDAYSFSEHMQLNDFRNFLNVALLFKEYEWAEKFINEYSEKLRADIRTNAVLLARASMALSRKDYDTARSFLSKVKPDSLYFKHDIKRMELVICFEKEEYSAAMEMIDSYKHFLKSNKGVSELRKDAVWNFLNAAMDIIKIKTGASRKSPGLVSAKIATMQPISNKAWLIEKAAGLSAG